MQLILNGPDIPEELLQAQAEGRVVFFCGAGISMNADLPSFRALVEDIYSQCNVIQNNVEKRLFELGEYDRTLDLLERRIVNGKQAVRQTVAKILEKPLKEVGYEKKLSLHKALLRLSRNSEGEIRLVTTNYDHCFYRASKELSIDLNQYSAPCLPIAKKSKWNGVVFLHGLLPNNDNNLAALNNLILTSGDFGAAYLTERWAARFVSELFRNFVVCFVGYSLNDSVLRYMMDAISADRDLGENISKVWVLTKSDNEDSEREQWLAKGVTPILGASHQLVNQTIEKWAEIFSSGITGKKAIIQTYGSLMPEKSTSEDDFIKKIIWAISDDSGLLAKYFAELKDTPPLEWFLEVFTRENLTAKDLIHLGLLPYQDICALEGKKYSLIRRPPICKWALPIGLVETDPQPEYNDKILYQLMRWLCKHLNDPRLLLWMTKHTGHMNDHFRFLVWETLGGLKNNGKQVGQDSKQVIHPAMSLLWQLYLEGFFAQGEAYYDDLEFYNWKESFIDSGITIAWKSRLHQFLSPVISLSLPYQKSNKSNKQESLRDFVSWEIRLKKQNALSEFRGLKSKDKWVSALPSLMEDFEGLLLRALELEKEMGTDVARYDPACFSMPSIEEHEQNSCYTDWILLIELVRDAWIKINEVDDKKSAQIAKKWILMPYLTFKRLGLFAAKHCKRVTVKTWVRWLSNSENLFWNPYLKREILQLLYHRATELTGPELKKIERETFKQEKLYATNSIEQAQDSYAIMMRLKPLLLAELELPKKSKEFINDFLKQHPDYQVNYDEVETFSVWHSAHSWVEADSGALFSLSDDELYVWLKKSTKANINDWYGNPWMCLCKAQTERCWNVCKQLALLYNHWPIDNWRQLIYVTSNKELSAEFYKSVWNIIEGIPNEVYELLALEIAQFLYAFSKTQKLDDYAQTQILANCERIFSLPEIEETDSNRQNLGALTWAINHPFGIVAQTLVTILFSDRLVANATLPSSLKPLFTQCFESPNSQKYLPARIIFASRLVQLHSLDPAWTSTYLAPRLDGTQYPSDSMAMWEGFLWSPRANLSTTLLIKEQIIQAIDYIAQFSNSGQLQFVRYLTNVLVLHGDLFPPSLIQEKIKQTELYSQTGMIRTLAKMLESIENDKKVAFWSTQIKPFWLNFWPKDKGLISPELCESIIDLMIAYPPIFSEMLEFFRDWLIPIKRTVVVYRLRDRGMHKTYPLEVLELLSRIFKNCLPTDIYDLERLLNEMDRSVVAEDPTFKQYIAYLK